MAYDFRPIEPTTDFSLTIALAITGTSGTGKTYSGMLAARGLADGKPIAVIDTENKRALHYRRDFPEMQHYNFGPYDGDRLVGFPPERWIALLDQIEQTNAGAIVIDSFSHAWEGIQGVLELQAAEVEKLSGGDAQKAARVGQLAWAAVKPRYRRLIERIVQSKKHVVICLRAKPVMQEKSRATDWKEVNARKTKLRRDDLPWDVAGDADLIFEMTASMVMVPERPGEPILLKCPDHFKSLFAGNARVNPEIGKAMADWALGGGDDGSVKEIMDEAEEIARRGRDAFAKWWNLDSTKATKRSVVRGDLDRLKSIAARAVGSEDDDEDVFGDEPEADRSPSPSKEDFDRALKVLGSITDDIGNGAPIADVRDTYEDQIEQVKATAPDVHKQIEVALS